MMVTNHIQISQLEQVPAVLVVWGIRDGKCSEHDSDVGSKTGMLNLEVYSLSVQFGLDQRKIVN